MLVFDWWNCWWVLFCVSVCVLCRGGVSPSAAHYILPRPWRRRRRVTISHVSLIDILFWRLIRHCCAAIRYRLWQWWCWWCRLRDFIHYILVTIQSLWCIFIAVVACCSFHGEGGQPKPSFYAYDEAIYCPEELEDITDAVFVYYVCIVYCYWSGMPEDPLLCSGELRYSGWPLHSGNYLLPDWYIGNSDTHFVMTTETLRLRLRLWSRGLPSVPTRPGPSVRLRCCGEGLVIQLTCYSSLLLMPIDCLLILTTK